MRKPVVAIVGRPNVGKSTLFNRIIKKRKAIVHELSGLTRDRHYETTDWDGVEFDIVDTGGFVPHPQEKMEQAIKEQVEFSIQEAAQIVFVVDVLTGITRDDELFGRLLLKSGKPIILAVNKVDNTTRVFDTPEFYKLGFGEPVAISAVSGRCIGDLLDRIVTGIGKSSQKKQEPEEGEIKIAVIGKPNVGKSSFVNALLQSSKMIVTDIPGTTRDAIDSVLRYKQCLFRIIDTAGLRKGKHGLEGIEYYSGIRALQSIDRSDVVVMMIDAQSGIERQDQKIMGYVLEKKKGMLLAFNKWDLVAENSDTIRELNRDTEKKLRRNEFLPSITLSALHGKRVYKVLDMVIDIWNERSKRIPTHELNEVIRDAMTRIPPNRYKGRKVDIKYCTQIGESPPVLAFIATNPLGITDQYQQYLEKNIRSHFGFAGVPLTFKLRKR